MSVREIRALLAHAYRDDPLFRWIFPIESTRLDAAAAWLGLFVESYVESGHVDTLGDGAPDAVAIWRMPDTRLTTPSWPSIAGLLGALVGPERAAEIGGGLAAIRELTPAEPHAYLHFMAVAPELQQRGLGRTVLERGIRRAAAAGLGVHLETTNPDAVGFYERLGFATSGRVELSPSGPPLWAMRLGPPVGAHT